MNSTSTHTHSLLQERVTKFGFYAAIVAILSIAFRIYPVMRHYGARALVSPPQIAHGLSMVPVLVVWLVTRRKARTDRFLRWAEGGALFTSCSSYALMGYGIQREAHALGTEPITSSAQLITILAMSLVTFARTILVPSPPMHTFRVTALAATGLMLLASPLGGHCATDTFGNPSLPYLGTMLGAAMWWTLVTLLATLSSDVIYGLRREADVAKQYGQYTLLEKIGEGGMGVVYRAQHRLLRRPTAVKLLPPERAGTLGIARFEHEVQLTAQLTHPNTVTIFDYGRTPRGAFYYAMELLDGETLQDIVEATGPMRPARAIHVLMQVASALGEAHERGLIHRDIKPANIMLCSQGGIKDVAKVLDFGLAYDLNLREPSTAALSGIVAGTPQYLAPETLSQPGTMSTSADIYAFGGVAFWLLTGQTLYGGQTVVEVCTMHLHSPIPALSERCRDALPTGLEEIITECLAKSPETRPTARELVARLRDCVLHDWTDDDAEIWWQKHRAHVGERRRAALTPGASATLEVDFAGR